MAIVKLELERGTDVLLLETGDALLLEKSTAVALSIIIAAYHYMHHLRSMTN